MQGSQSTFGEFSDDSPDLFEFDDYGPTGDRPIPEAERSAIFMSGGEPVDRREIPDSGLSLSDITDWPSHGREESYPKARERFKQKMSEIHDTDSTEENRHEDAESGRFLPALQTIHQRDSDTYTPGQGTALDTVRALERKADCRAIADWSTLEIEAALYNLGHLMTELRIAAGDHPGTNCKRLSTAAEALHQDLIDELQARDRWTADTRQYLTNQFGSICSGIEYGNKPQYTAENCYFEEIQQLTDIGDRITTIFEEGDGLEICEGCGHKMVSGEWDVCADCADDQGADDVDDDQDDNDARSTTRAVATDGGTIEGDGCAAMTYDFETLDEIPRGAVLSLDKHRGEFLVVNRKEVPHGTVQAIDVVDEQGTEYRLDVVALGGDRYFDLSLGHETAPVKMADNLEDVREFDVIRRDQDWLEDYLAEKYSHFSK